MSALSTALHYQTCQGLADAMAPMRFIKQHQPQATADHYGVCTGKRRYRQICRRLRDFIHVLDEQDTADFSTAKQSFLEHRAP